METVIRVRFGLSGYRRFLISLIASDLYICFINIITFCLPLAGSLLDKCTADLIRILQIIGFIVNLLNLCAMTVDHFMGIVHPLRYRQFLSKRVTGCILLFIWISSFMIGFVDVFLSLFKSLHRWIIDKLESDEQEDTLKANQIQNSKPAVVQPNLSDILNNLMLFTSKFETMTKTSSPKPQSLFRSMRSVDFYDVPLANTGPISILPRTGGSFNWNQRTTPSGSGGYANNMDKLVRDTLQSLGVSDKMDDSTHPMESSFVQSSNILSVFNDDQQTDVNGGWCRATKQENVWLEYSVMTLTSICFIFLVVCYGRIFKEVFFNRGSSSQGMRRLALTTFTLVGSFMFCWLPFMIFEFSMIVLLSNRDNGGISASAL